VFEQLGGFESVATVLAEDYVIGRMFRTAGYQVRLATVVLDNVRTRGSVGDFMRRNMRWSAMRWRLKPLAYPFEILTIPVAVAALAPLMGASLPIALLWAVGLTWFRDAALWAVLRDPDELFRPILVGPIKDFLILVVWLIAPFQREIEWRGNRVRLSAGTRLYTSQLLGHASKPSIRA